MLAVRSHQLLHTVLSKESHSTPSASLFQNEWERLHIGNEHNARAASRCDALVSQLHQRVEKQWREVETLQMLVAQLPKVNRQIREVTDALGKRDSRIDHMDVGFLASYLCKF